MKSKEGKRCTTSLAQSRHVLGILFLIFGGLFSAVLIVEMALRVAGISERNPFILDSSVGWVHRPSIAGYAREEGGAYWRINSEGWRDREHTKEKPNDTIRIAILGNSYAEALNIPLENTFGAIMEHELQQCPTLNDEHVETLNFGVASYNTAQDLITLRDRVWDYSPDVVVLIFGAANDVENNSKVLAEERLRPFFAVHNDKLVLDTSFRETSVFRFRTSSLAYRGYYFLRDHLGTVQVLRRFINTAKARKARPAENPSQELGLDDAVFREPKPTDIAWQQAWEITDKLLIAMRNEVRARGAYFMVVSLGTGVQDNPDPSIREVLMRQLGVDNLSYPDRRLKSLGDREHFQVLNLAPAFQAYAIQRKAYLHGSGKSRGLGHWNVDGHHLAGTMIAQALCKGMEDGPIHGALKRQADTAATYPGTTTHKPVGDGHEVHP